MSPEPIQEQYIEVNNDMIDEVNEQLYAAANPSLISPLSSGNQKTRNNTFLKKTDIQTENSRTQLPIRITRNKSEAKTFKPRKLITYKDA